MAVITDMSQPLGNTVGNSVEVMEAIEALCGRGPKDLMEVVYALGYGMLKAGGKAEDYDSAVALMKQVITSGAALDKLAELVSAQGGDESMVYNPQTLPQASITKEVIADCAGIVASIDALSIGTACMSLGGGRATKESQIDLSVGIRLCHKVADTVSKGTCLAYIYANDETKCDQALAMVRAAFTISNEKVTAPPTVYTYITE